MEAAKEGTRDLVVTEVLEPDAKDLACGVVSVMVMTYRRAAVVIVEGSDGMVGIGRSCPWPEHIYERDKAIRRAHGRALNKLNVARRWREEYGPGGTRNPDRRRGRGPAREPAGEHLAAMAGE